MSKQYPPAVFLESPKAGGGDSAPSLDFAEGEFPGSRPPKPEELGEDAPGGDAEEALAGPVIDVKPYLYS